MTEPTTLEKRLVIAEFMGERTKGAFVRIQNYDIDWNSLIPVIKMVETKSRMVMEAKKGEVIFDIDIQFDEVYKRILKLKK